MKITRTFITRDVLTEIAVAQQFRTNNYDDAEYALAHRDEFAYLTAAEWERCELTVALFWSRTDIEEV